MKEISDKVGDPDDEIGSGTFIFVPLIGRLESGFGVRRFDGSIEIGYVAISGGSTRLLDQ